MTDAIKHRCPTCGHPLLPRDPLAILKPTQRAVFDAIYSAGQVGITRDAIVERVWGNRNTTPESQTIVSTYMVQINKRIAYLHMRIWGEGKPKHYRVVSTHDRRDRYSEEMRSESSARRHVNGNS